MKTAILKQEGLHRILDGRVGLTFPIESLHMRSAKYNDGFVIVRDYRFPGEHFPYQCWSVDLTQIELLETVK